MAQFSFLEGMKNLRDLQLAPVRRLAFERRKFDEKREDEELDRAEAELKTEEIKGFLNTAFDPENTFRQINEAIAQITILDPEIGKQVGEITRSGNKQRKDAMVQGAVRANNFATSTLALPDDQIRAEFLKEINIQIADPNTPPPKRLIAALNESADIQRTELRRIQVMARGALTIGQLDVEAQKQVNRLANQAQFETVFDKSGNIVAQRNINSGQVVTDPRSVSTIQNSGRFTKGPPVIVEDANGNKFQEIAVLNERTGDIERKRIPIGGEVISRQFGETGAQQTTRRVGEAGGIRGAELVQEIELGAEVSAQKKRGSAVEARAQEAIGAAITVATAIPRLERSLKLLETINTGSFAAIALKFKKQFGIESADEGELIFNTAKNVLKQLKPTFGAAFTEREGNLLTTIEAGIGKSKAANMRLIRQALQITRNAVERGQRAAANRKDEEALRDIEEALNLDLSPEGLGKVQPPQKEANATDTGRTTQEGFPIFERPDGSTFAVTP